MTTDEIYIICLQQMLEDKRVDDALALINNWHGHKRAYYGDKRWAELYTQPH